MRTRTAWGTGQSELGTSSTDEKEASSPSTSWMRYLSTIYESTKMGLSYTRRGSHSLMWYDGPSLRTWHSIWARRSSTSGPTSSSKSRQATTQAPPQT